MDNRDEQALKYGEMLNAQGPPVDEEPLPEEANPISTVTITATRVGAVIDKLKVGQSKLDDAELLINQMAMGKGGATAGAMLTQIGGIGEAYGSITSVINQLEVVHDELASL